MRSDDPMTDTTTPETAAPTTATPETAPDPLNGLVRPELLALADYNAGVSLEKMRAELGLDRVVKLDSNENPLSCSPAVGPAMQAVQDRIFRYPDREELRLRAALSRDLGVGPDRLAFTAGSEDLVSILFRMVLRPGDTVLTAVPAFGLYEICAQHASAHTQKVPFNADWSFPVDALIAALADRPRVLVICSPCNPVGAAITLDDLDRLLRAASADTLVVLDEAYVEFMDDATRGQHFKRLKAHDGPWMALRTFSKAYGLAGLRIGYGIAHHPALAAAVYKVRSPFNVSATALAGAEAAYGDQDHVGATRDFVAGERDRVAAALRAMGLDPAPSQGNFLFFDCRRPARAVADRLRAQGVLIKPWHEADYLTCARVTIGRAEDNDTFLATLKRVLAEDAL
ncbi:MAG: histidinol-phosphate transaminase [Confluentimicrobium sp.]|nr:histidinol-phosphate transaminase [Actibacterium sp.]|tara:strand:+ start:1753 stop:2949 length:1197 start_codon:yes stop_codon:yes gene_type:complete